MAPRLPIIGIALVLAGSCLAAPPGIFEMGAFGSNTSGAHLAYSGYFSESNFLQIRLEESLLNLHPRISNLQQVTIGSGYEQEFSSHLFFRLTGGLGIGQASMRIHPGPTQDIYLGTVRITPDLAWFPSGRFSTIGFGLNAGVNLEYRKTLGHRALPSSLSNQGAQIFAGLVL